MPHNVRSVELLGGNAKKMLSPGGSAHLVDQVTIKNCDTIGAHPGPVLMDNALDWIPEKLLQMSKTPLWEVLQDNVQSGLCISSDYSGTKHFETVFKWLVPAMQEGGASCGPLHFTRSGDLAEQCRKVALADPDGFCVHGNMQHCQLC